MLPLALFAAAVLAGCGGSVGTDGTGQPQTANTSVLQGTVYTSGPIPAAAGEAPGARPLYDATVQLRRMDNNAYVADTMTSSTGRYHFPSLQRGLDLLIVVSARSGEVLMGRALLDAATVTADIDEDTTLVTRCQLLARANGGGQVGEDVEATVSMLCAQFQHQHRYQYGNLGGERPDFTNQDAQWRAAAALLRAATDWAVQCARETGDDQWCERAVQMVQARLQAEGRINFPFDAALRARIANALRNRAAFAEEDIAAAISAALGQPLTIQSLANLRAQITWGCVQGRTGPFDVIDALVAACCGACGQEHRVRTAEQLGVFLQALVG